MNIQGSFTYPCTYVYIYIIHFLFRVPSAFHLGAISLLVADAIVYGGASVAWLCLHEIWVDLRVWGLGFKRFWGLPVLRSQMGG